MFLRSYLFEAAILPHLTYCSIVWHFFKASDSRKLERVQERGLKSVYCDWNSSYSQLFEWANLPTLKKRRLQDIAITMFRVKNELCPQYIKDLFEFNKSSYNLRMKEFMTPMFNTSYGKHSLRYLGPQLWSKLDSNIRNAPSIGVLKKAIRKVDLDVFISNNCKNCILRSS